ncbi:MAG: STAS domain-containing protein [Nitrospirae bacterium]|nr:MAG: STAS domain-containing protein [Nitrospirota bacterium]
MRTIRFRIMEDYRLDPVEGFAHFVSLEKIAFFDLSLIIDTIAYERERLIHDQHNAILLLSTPVLRVRKHLLILPLIGVIDPERAKRFTETLLEAVRLYRAKVVVVDLTGVAGMDVAVTNHLAQTMLAARLIGATTILTGMSPSVAETINTVGIDTTLLKTALDLEAGIEEAERMIGHTAA